ncbi:DUF1801 domain-containing protein [Amorphus coralli]|uniref:DUF1801 domain-containing protein n=1 Tax=Amorphus coralli TaxID=340680 RepID=UPI00038167BC|nr:DUF1801 domain-containing protein [Amorphus coralli]
MTVRAPVPDPPAEVARAFDAFPAAVRTRLLEVRALIFSTADGLDGVGPLTETLKWGEPAYLTEASRSGTTIRLGVLRDAPPTPALFVNCQTTLADDFRALAPELECRGSRALLLPATGPLDAEPLRRCLALALTYKRRRRGGPASPTERR